MEIAANQPRMPDETPESATLEDGGNTTPSYDPPPAPAPAKDEGEERTEPTHFKDEKRAEIYNRARERRLEETQPFSGNPNDPDALYGSNVNQDELGPLEQEAMRRRQERLGEIAQQPQGQQQPEGQQQQGQGQQPRPLNGISPELLAQSVPIVVDGHERTVSMEELVRNFQIDQAAQRRLEQAKALLQQTQEFQRYQQPQPGRQGAEYDEPSGQDDSTHGQDDLDNGPDYTSRKHSNVKELVEKIQLGTPDEAAMALEEFVSSAVNRAPAVDETTRVLTALEDHNSQQAVLAFNEKNPQLVANPVLSQVAMKQIHKGMAEDLMRAGYTLDQLREIAPTQQHLTQLHKQARIQRVRGVRPVMDLVSAGYQGAMQELRSLVDTTAPLVAPNPAPNMGQRQQRKETLQPQPAARRLSPGMAQQTQAKTQDQSRASAVQRMRQARGQPT